MRQTSNQRRLDAMIEFSVEEVAYDNIERINRIPRELVTRWPGEIALATPFALSSAAAEIDSFIKGGAKQSNLVYRLSALLAADIYAVQAKEQRLIYASDLMSYWRSEDPFFLEI